MEFSQNSLFQKPKTHKTADKRTMKNLFIFKDNEYFDRISARTYY